MFDDELMSIELSELEHHGIAGQKWGKRNAGWYPISAWKEHLANSGKKDVDSGGSGSGKSSDGTTKTHGGSSSGSSGSSSGRKVKKESIRDPRNMSDDELRTKVNRMQLEKQYSDLKRSQNSLFKSLIDRGIRRLGEGVLDRSVDALLGKIFNKEEPKEIPDLKKYISGDFMDMSYDEVRKASKYWENVNNIYKSRAKYLNKNSSSYDEDEED